MCTCRSCQAQYHFANGSQSVEINQSVSVEEVLNLKTDCPVQDSREVKVI